jgi:hypothetical protein
MKKLQIIPILLIVASILFTSERARSQDLVLPDAPSAAVVATTSSQAEPMYARPARGIMFENYAYDTFGPYPVVSAAFTAGMSQSSNAPPEWHQGAKGYARRFGSDFGMAATATTTRYALSAMLKEDALYYRCECRAFLPRFRHAVLSTATARNERDGHRVLSIPAILAPYVGSTVAVYGWYPDRFGAKDALRMGSYSLLASVGGNVALEFLYRGPRSLLSHVRINSSGSAPDPGSNQ